MLLSLLRDYEQTYKISLKNSELRQESLLMQRQTRDSLGIGRNSLNHPSLTNAKQYQSHLYILEKYIQCATIPSLTSRDYLHSFSRCCLPKMRSSAKFRENSDL